MTEPLRPVDQQALAQLMIELIAWLDDEGHDAIATLRKRLRPPRVDAATFAAIDDILGSAEGREA